MTPLAQTVYLASTDPDFRRALQAGPQAAAAAHGLALSEEQLGVLYALRPLLDLSPDELVQTILGDEPLPPWYAVP